MNGKEVKSVVSAWLRQNNVFFNGATVKKSSVSFYMIKTQRQNVDIDEVCVDLMSEIGLSVDHKYTTTRRLSDTRQSLVLNVYL